MTLRQMQNRLTWVHPTSPPALSPNWTTEILLHLSSLLPPLTVLLFWVCSVSGRCVFGWWR